MKQFVFLLKPPTSYWKTGAIMHAHEIRLDRFAFHNFYQNNQALILLARSKTCIYLTSDKKFF